MADQALQITAEKHSTTRSASLLLLILVTSLCACNPAVVDEQVTEAPTIDSGCGHDGALRSDLFGSIETRIDWSGSNMRCESMPRPDQEGVRLRFVGDVASSKLALIIALPKLQRGEAMPESPSNVTATVEGSGRFFSTANLDACWTDVNTQAAIDDNDSQFVLSGTLYCVLPLGEVNGDAAITIPELSFTTIVDWENS